MPREAQEGNVCFQTFCPLQILTKEVNGHKLEFHPCCMTCESCNDVYDPVCVLKEECKGEKCEEKFVTMTNVCHACISSAVGSYAPSACPEPETAPLNPYDQAVDAILSYVEQVTEIVESAVDSALDVVEHVFGTEVDEPDLQEGEVWLDDWNDKGGAYSLYKGDNLLCDDLFDEDPRQPPLE